MTAASSANKACMRRCFLCHRACLYVCLAALCALRELQEHT